MIFSKLSRAYIWVQRRLGVEGLVSDALGDAFFRVISSNVPHADAPGSY